MYSRFVPETGTRSWVSGQNTDHLDLTTAAFRCTSCTHASGRTHPGSVFFACSQEKEHRDSATETGGETRPMNLDLDFENMRRSDLSGVSDFFRLHTSRRRTNMKKLIAVFFTLSLLMCGVTVAQDTMKQDNMKADASAKAVKITGKISDDGKTFVNDKDSKSWTIQNPDAIKGHEGHHVTLSAHVYADKGEVHVMSLKMAK
jgi:hypothetical protein